MKHELAPVIRSEKRGANMDTVIDHVNEQVAKLLANRLQTRSWWSLFWRLVIFQFTTSLIIDVHLYTGCIPLKQSRGWSSLGPKKVRLISCWRFPNRAGLISIVYIYRFSIYCF
jgi:hypothetical protein